MRVLLALAHRDSHLYIEVVSYYLGNNEQLNLNLEPYLLVQVLIEIFGSIKTYDLLSQINCLSKARWLFAFYICLPQSEITGKYLNQLYILYQTSQVNEIPHNLIFLLKYRSVDETVVIQVTDILIQRSNEDLNYSRAFITLFNPYSEINKAIPELFQANSSLLKQAYFVGLELEAHLDDGQTFAHILEVDSSFLVDYIDWVYQQEDRLRREDFRDFSCVWKRNDYKKLMQEVIERIYNHNRLGLWQITDGFFVLRAEEKDTDLLQERQYQFLKYLIEQRYSDANFMIFIFEFITNLSFENRKQLLAVFLEHNKSFKDFRHLPLKPSSWICEGGSVPIYYQKLTEYFESLLPLLSTIEFLQHRQYLERIIQETRETIEDEKKRNFLRE